MIKKEDIYLQAGYLNSEETRSDMEKYIHVVLKPDVVIFPTFTTGEKILQDRVSGKEEKRDLMRSSLENYVYSCREYVKFINMECWVNKILERSPLKSEETKEKFNAEMNEFTYRTGELKKDVLVEYDPKAPVPLPKSVRMGRWERITNTVESEVEYNKCSGLFMLLDRGAREKVNEALGGKGFIIVPSAKEYSTLIAADQIIKSGFMLNVQESRRCLKMATTSSPPGITPISRTLFWVHPYNMEIEAFDESMSDEDVINKIDDELHSLSWGEAVKKSIKGGE